MFRIFSIIIALICGSFIFTSCSDKDMEDMRQMLKDSDSKLSESSSAVQSSSSGASNSSVSQSSNAEEQSGSTALDNKPPKQSQEDGVTIRITQSDLDDLSDAAKSASEAIAAIPEASYEIPTFESRDDIKFDPSNGWKDEIENGRESPDRYSWEDDANIPDLEFDVPIPEFSGQGDGDTGYSGGTVPDFSSSK